MLSGVLMVYKRVGLIYWGFEMVGVMGSLILMVRMWAMCIAIDIL